jgi:hypothetical protein
VIPDTVLKIFTDFKGQIDESILGNYLNISESFIRFSNGDRLTREGIKEIQKKFGGALNGTLFPGGQDAIFAWSIPIGNFDVLLKPYYKKELFVLLIHYLSVEEYGDTRTYKMDHDLVTNIIIPPVIGVANITLDTRSIPVLITTESKGEPVLNHPSIVAKLGEVAKSLAYEGFIVDLYPSNWRFHPSSSELTLEYIDLITSKNLVNVKERVFNLIKDLTKEEER